MPAAISYIDPNSKERSEFLKDVSSMTEFYDRKRVFNRNEAYYNGDYPEYLVEDEETGINPNVVINIFRQVVDRTISFIFPSTPQMVTDEDNVGQSEEEVFLKNAIDFNGGVVMLAGIAYNGSLGGHCFVRVSPPDEFAEDGGKYPQITNLDPRRVQVYWDARSIKRILWYEINYSAGGDSFIEDVVFDRDGKRWVMYTYQRVNGAGSWVLVNTDTWDSILSPIVDWQHLPNPNQFYGTAEMSNDIEHLNNTLNRVASDIGLILRYHASPKTVATGVSSADIEPTAVNGLWSIINPDAKVENLEMQSDLQSSVGFMQYLSDAILAEARVVIMRGTVKDFQRVTNTGIRAVFLDMLSKNQLLRWSYGDGLQKIARRVLVSSKMRDIRPAVVWVDPLPIDETEIVNNLSVERAMQTVSRETASRERGRNWDAESRRMKEEEKQFPDPVKTGATPSAKQKGTVKENVDSEIG